VFSVTRYRVYPTDYDAKGWTTDKEEMEYDYIWADKESDVHKMAKC
jgi:hypothetical protein